jgi:hypothetical protein
MNSADSALLARFGVSLEEPDEILGFSSTIDGPISLTPIQSNRRVIAVRHRPPTTTSSQSSVLFTVVEPFHDSNKIYSSLSGLPFGPFVGFDPESIGFESFAERLGGGEAGQVEALEEPRIDEMLIGGSWVGAGQKISPPHKVLVAVLAVGSGQWRGVLVPRAALGGLRSDDIVEAIENGKDKDILQQHEESIIVPICCPKRVKRDGGVVFVG